MTNKKQTYFGYCSNCDEEFFSESKIEYTFKNGWKIVCCRSCGRELCRVPEKKSLFCKITDFMEAEGFKHTDQTIDGQDIFIKDNDKVIIEIIESEVDEK